MWQGLSVGCALWRKEWGLGKEGLNSRENPETEHIGLRDWLAEEFLGSYSEKICMFTILLSVPDSVFFLLTSTWIVCEKERIQTK